MSDWPKCNVQDHGAPQQNNQTQRVCCHLDTSINTLGPCTLFSPESPGVGDTARPKVDSTCPTANPTWHSTTTSTPMAKSTIPVDTPYITVFDAIVLSGLMPWSCQLTRSKRACCRLSNRHCREYVENMSRICIPFRHVKSSRVYIDTN